MDSLIVMDSLSKIDIIDSLSKIDILSQINRPNIMDLIIENIKKKQGLQQYDSNIKEDNHDVIPDLEKMKKIIQLEERLKLKKQELINVNRKLKNKYIENNNKNPNIVININNSDKKQDAILEKEKPVLDTSPLKIVSPLKKPIDSKNIIPLKIGIPLKKPIDSKTIIPLKIGTKEEPLKLGIPLKNPIDSKTIIPLKIGSITKEEPLKIGSITKEEPLKNPIDSTTNIPLKFGSITKEEPLKNPIDNTTNIPLKIGSITKEEPLKIGIPLKKTIDSTTNIPLEFGKKEEPLKIDIPLQKENISPLKSVNNPQFNQEPNNNQNDKNDRNDKNNRIFNNDNQNNRIFNNDNQNDNFFNEPNRTLPFQSTRMPSQINQEYSQPFYTNQNDRTIYQQPNQFISPQPIQNTRLPVNNNNNNDNNIINQPNRIIPNNNNNNNDRFRLNNNNNNQRNINQRLPISGNAYDSDKFINEISKIDNLKKNLQRENSNKIIAINNNPHLEQLRERYIKDQQMWNNEQKNLVDGFKTIYQHLQQLVINNKLSEQNMDDALIEQDNISKIISNLEQKLIFK